MRGDALARRTWRAPDATDAPTAPSASGMMTKSALKIVIDNFGQIPSCFSIPNLLADGNVMILIQLVLWMRSVLVLRSRGALRRGQALLVHSQDGGVQ